MNSKNGEIYFELEERSEIKHEYLDGQVTTMAGITLDNNTLIDNIKYPIINKFKPKGCRVFSESVKLEVTKHFYYP